MKAKWKMDNLTQLRNWDSAAKAFCQQKLCKACLHTCCENKCEHQENGHQGTHIYIIYI